MIKMKVKDKVLELLKKERYTGPQLATKLSENRSTIKTTLWRLEKQNKIVPVGKIGHQKLFGIHKIDPDIRLLSKKEQIIPFYNGVNPANYFPTHTVKNIIRNIPADKLEKFYLIKLKIPRKTMRISPKLAVKRLKWYFEKSYQEGRELTKSEITRILKKK